MQEYLNITEVAQMLRPGERVVYEMLRHARLSGAAKVGGKWRVDNAKLIDWIAKGGELAEGSKADEH